MFLCKTRNFRFFNNVLSNSHFLKCSMNLCWIFVFFSNFAKWKTRILINFDFFFRILFHESLSSFFFDDTIKNQRFYCTVFLSFFVAECCVVFAKNIHCLFFPLNSNCRLCCSNLVFSFFRNQSWKENFDVDWLKCGLIDQMICLWQEQRCKSWNKKNDKLMLRLFCVKAAK